MPVRRNSTLTKRWCGRGGVGANSSPSGRLADLLPRARYAAPRERSPLGTERPVVSGDNFVGAVACSLISCAAVQDDQRKHELWR
jgi:hypothetical protein